MQEACAAAAALLLIGGLGLALQAPETPSAPLPSRMPTITHAESAPAPALLYAPPVWTPLDVPMSAELQRFAAGVCAAANPPVALETVVAIIEHESGFDPAAIGHNADGSQDYGLMQINSSALPMLQEELGIRSMDELIDPWANLQAGVHILSLHTAAFPDAPEAALMAYQSGAGGARAKLARGVTGTAFSQEIIERAEELQIGN